MKKLLALALTLALAMSFIACGGGARNDGAAGTAGESPAKDKISLDDLNNDNWQAVVKAYCGIDLALPEGWTLESAESPNKITNIKLVFKSNGAGEDDFGKAIFDMTKAVSRIESFKDGKTIDTVTSYDEVKEETNKASWSYYPERNGKGANTGVTYFYLDGRVTLNFICN